MLIFHKWLKLLYWVDILLFLTIPGLLGIWISSAFTIRDNIVLNIYLDVCKDKVL